MTVSVSFNWIFSSWVFGIILSLHNHLSQSVSHCGYIPQICDIVQYKVFENFNYFFHWSMNFLAVDFLSHTCFGKGIYVIDFSFICIVICMIETFWYLLRFALWHYNIVSFINSPYMFDNNVYFLIPIGSSLWLVFFSLSLFCCLINLVSEEARLKSACLCVDSMYVMSIILGTYKYKLWHLLGESFILLLIVYFIPNNDFLWFYFGFSLLGIFLNIHSLSIFMWF